MNNPSGAKAEPFFSRRQHSEHGSVSPYSLLARLLGAALLGVLWTVGNALAHGYIMTHDGVGPPPR